LTLYSRSSPTRLSGFVIKHDVWIFALCWRKSRLLVERYSQDNYDNYQSGTNGGQDYGGFIHSFRAK
jgi:hypothetical protein